MTSKKEVKNQIVKITYGESAEILSGLDLVSGIFIPDIDVSFNLGLIRKTLAVYKEAADDATKILFEELSEEKSVPAEQTEAEKKAGKAPKKEKKQVIPAGEKTKFYQDSIRKLSNREIEVDIPLLDRSKFVPDEDDEDDARRQIPNLFFQVTLPIFKGTSFEKPKVDAITLPSFKKEVE